MLESKEIETEQEEQSVEEIVDDEQLEIEREISEYKAKIEALDVKLAEYKTASIAEIKRDEMRKMNYDDSQIERYLAHVQGESLEDIKSSVLKLTLEIPPSENYGDPSAFNGAKEKPTHADPGEIGKQVFERVKNKINWRSIF